MESQDITNGGCAKRQREETKFLPDRRINLADRFDCIRRVMESSVIFVRFQGHP